MSSDGQNKLVRMANQIADNFDYGSDREASVAGVLDHLIRFWTPEMKEAIVEIGKQGGGGLNEIASRAVQGLAEETGQPA